MKTKEKEKLIQTVLNRLKKDNYTFNFKMSLEREIEGLEKEIEIQLTDSDKNLKEKIGYSIVVGEVKGHEEFSILGIRSNFECFALDLMDIKRNCIYSLIMMGKFIAIINCQKLTKLYNQILSNEIDMNMALRMLDYKIKNGESKEIISNFENVASKKPLNNECVRLYLQKVASSSSDLSTVASCMYNDLQENEVYVYVNVVYHYFSENLSLNIENFADDKIFVKMFNKILNTKIANAYELFKKYPSQLFIVYDKIVKEYDNNALFGELGDDITTYLY